MKDEILLNVTPREVRAALLENGVLHEIFIERAGKRGLISNIYKGRVSRVLPGMQAAFIDIGLERTAFLHVSDIAHAAPLENGIESPRPGNIRELVSEGGEILVQVLKDPIGSKGARLTTYITIPSRYLVYMPHGQGIGISARIEDEQERCRLRELLEAFAGDDQPGGFIIRTAAEGASLDALRADMMFLRKLWEVVGAGAVHTSPRELVHEDLPLENTAGSDERADGARASGFRGDLQTHAGICKDVHSGTRAASGTLYGPAPHFRFVRSRRGDPESAGTQGTAQVGRIPDHRPD